MSNIAIARLQKEITMLHRDPPPGAWAGPIDGKPLTELEARIQGPADTVYEAGVFKLSIHIPMRYPIEPPKVRFITPVYHPNIDAEGRICLDILNPPPKGAWKPSINISTVLTSIALLLAEPNPDDGLVTDTTYEYKHQRDMFESKARAWTRQHAVQLKEEEKKEERREAVAPEIAGSTIAIESSAPKEQENQQQQQEQLVQGSDTLENSNGAAQAELEEDVEGGAPNQVLSEGKRQLDGGGESNGKENALGSEKKSVEAIETKGGQQHTQLQEHPPQKRSKLTLQHHHH